MTEIKPYLFIAIAALLISTVFMVVLATASTASIPTTVSTVSTTKSTSSSSASTTTVSGAHYYSCNSCQKVQTGYFCPGNCPYSQGCSGSGGIVIECEATSTSTYLTTSSTTSVPVGGYCNGGALSIEDSSGGCGPIPVANSVATFVTVNIQGSSGESVIVYVTATTAGATCPTGSSPNYGMVTLDSSGAGSYTGSITVPSGSQVCYVAADSSGSPVSNPIAYVASSGGGGGSGASLSANGIVAQVCSIYLAASTVIFILSLTLMILGGAIYAGAQLIPAQTRGTVQGYAMGMVMGGIIGLVIALLAPYILGLVTGNSLLFSTACI